LIDDLAIDDFFKEKPPAPANEGEEEQEGKITVTCPQCGFVFEVEVK